MTRQEHLLTILSEEASEIVKEVSKCLRFGPDEIYKPIGITNAQRVVNEMMDLLAVYDMLQVEGVLPPACGYNRFIDHEKTQAKKNKVEKYLSYSKECGTLID